jgi:hypothetical protein
MATFHASQEENLSVTGQASGRVIANFAWQHLKAAVTFRDQVIALEAANLGNEFGAFFEDIRSYSSGCIMSGAASLEALINEFFITPDGPLRSKLANFESDFWGRGGIEWRPPLEKYQVALQMLGQEKLDESSGPYRDAWALVELRNALVHYKPTWDPDRQRKVELVEVLSGKYRTTPFVDEGSDFVTMKSMSAGCASWVVSTTIAFMRAFHDRARIDEHKMAGFYRFDT